MKALIGAVFALAIGMVISTLMIMVAMPHFLVLLLMVLIGYVLSYRRKPG